MPGLTDDKIALLKTLVAASPDEVVRGLEKAVCKEGTTGPLAAIGALVEAEAADRQVRFTTFQPLAPMFGPEAGDGRVTFPRAALGRIWQGLKADVPRLVEQAVEACYYIDPEEPWPAVFDTLCLQAASGLRAAETPDYVSAAAACDARRPGLSQTLVLALEIAPIVRPPLLRLGEWLQRMTNERRAVARLAYRDAEAVRQGGGPLMFEMLAAHLKQPWTILRIATSIMEHPGERYLAASELALFGDRALADIEAQVERVRHLRPGAGVEVALDAARAVQHAIDETGEFDQSVQLSRDGPWGQRLARLKHGLAAAVEVRLREIDEAVAQALPVVKVRYSGRLTSTAPKLDSPADEAAVAWAVGLLTFAAEIRNCATDGGFGGVRGKVLETIGQRIDHYVEDVLEQIRLGDIENDEIAREHLDVAARLLTLVRDRQAGAIVRRRAAAA
ncbi:hypothetical protein [Caulobacter mirabilis]|uniref:Uncharacterized protein n=1 Tax=Caulobacter mirabilis TaxID=69666 RepID=A0A2D2AVW2_9CAUL|nr:hypothetical protein [Caulobacter mirabilis]ATQ42148.1 hypothetical protein CSW64_06835 [Caulobacter mirabilis]